MKSAIVVKGSIWEDYRAEIICQNDLVLAQPTPTGGSWEEPSSPELLLSSLAGCYCSLGKIISNQRKLNISAINVTVEGDVDRDIFPGKKIGGWDGFTEIRSYMSIDGDLSEIEKEEFLKEILKKFPVANNVISNIRLISWKAKHPSETVTELAMHN